MASGKEYLDFILEQVSELDNVKMCIRDRLVSAYYRIKKA